MENKITYLIGAGASCGSDNRPCLPLVAGIPGSIKKFKTTFSHDYRRKIRKELWPTAQSIADELGWLHSEADRHSSIDTYAKKLTISSRTKDLIKLKNLLSTFFLCQELEVGIDPRYDSFLASILRTTCELPKNIRVLSWNYDHQFELAFREFSTNPDLGFNRSQLGCVGSWNHGTRWGDEIIDRNSLEFSS